MKPRITSVKVPRDIEPALKEVSDHFARGNEEEFLRLAVSSFQGRLRFSQLEKIRAEVRRELGGLAFSSDEILALIRNVD